MHPMPILPMMFSTAKENAGSYTAFSRHVPLASFHLEQFLSLPLCFILELTGHFGRGPSVWFVCCFLVIKFRLCTFCIHRSDVVFLSVHLIRRHMLVIPTFITWLRWLLPGLPTALLPLMSISWRFTETVKITCYSLNFHILILASVDDSCLRQ